MEIVLTLNIISCHFFLENVIKTEVDNKTDDGKNKQMHYLSSVLSSPLSLMRYVKQQ